MSIPEILSRRISSLDNRDTSHISEVLSSFLHTRGVNTNDTWSPSVDIVESEEYVDVFISVPGVTHSSIDIDFFGNKIHIKGIRDRPYDMTTTTSGIKVKKGEIMYGKFERKLTLPIHVIDRKNVKVHIKNGIICIHIVKDTSGVDHFSVRINENS